MFQGAGWLPLNNCLVHRDMCCLLLRRALCKLPGAVSGWFQQLSKESAAYAFHHLIAEAALAGFSVCRKN